MKKLICLFLISVFCISLFALIDTGGKAKDKVHLLETLTGEKKIQLYLELIEYHEIINIETAAMIAEEALQYAISYGNPDLEVRMRLKTGELHQERGEFVDAYKSFIRVSELSKEIDNKEVYVKSLINLAKLNLELSVVDKAVDLLFEALDLSYAINNENITAEILLEIGKSYKAKNDPQMAILYLTSARERYKKLNDTYLKINSDIIIATTYMDIRNFDLARWNAENALADGKKIGSQWHEALTYNHLAWISMMLEDYPQAIEYNRKAQKIREKNSYIVSISSKVNIGEVYLKWGKLSESKKILQEAAEDLRYKDSYNALKIKVRQLTVLIQVNELQGDYEAAYKNTKELSDINSTIEKQLDSDTLEHLQATYEIERHEEQRLIEHQMTVSSIEKKQTTIYALNLVIIFGLISGVLLVSRYNFRKKVAQSLEFKNNNLSELNRKLNKEIEERRVLEDQINSQKDHLHLINKILRHDLANDIATINSGISIYRRNNDEKIFDEISNRIKKSIQLINNMKKFESFMSSHDMLKTISARGIIEEIKQNYKEVELDPFTKCEVIADDSFSSVIENIVSNAITHGEASRVYISCNRKADKVLITIENNGKPIPELIIDKIYDEGFKFGDHANTGMGLYIVRKLMDGYGGFVDARNLEEGGVCFTLQFHSSI